MISLELDIQMIKSGKGVSFTVQIITQRLRGSAARFTATNGFIFTSLACPAIGNGYNVSNSLPPLMCLRGTAGGNDNTVLFTKSVGYTLRN